MRYNSNGTKFVSAPPVNPYDREFQLSEISAYEVRRLMPLILFYAIILVIGVIGNALVLLVYSFRYKRSPARVFILFLASIDFSICLFGLPYHLIDLTHPYTFTNKLTCKVLTFVITTLFHMSVFGLIVIAIDRYLKICMPLSALQLSFFKKRRACAGAAIAAVLFSWPNLVLYGPFDVETPVGNITGCACYFETQYLDTNYPLLYTVTILFVCIFCTVFLIVAYSLIYAKIYKRYTGFRRKPSTKFNTMVSCTEDVVLKSMDKDLNHLIKIDASPQHSPTLAKANKADTNGSQTLVERQRRLIPNSISQNRIDITNCSHSHTLNANDVPNKLNTEEQCNVQTLGDPHTSHLNGDQSVKTYPILDNTSNKPELEIKCEHRDRLFPIKCDSRYDTTYLNADGNKSCHICSGGSSSSVKSSGSVDTPDSLSKIILKRDISGSEASRSTGAINVSSCVGGFPMCIPQKLKRRSLDHYGPSSNLGHVHQRSVSLANLPGRCLNIMNECDGLRINANSSASVYTAASSNHVAQNQGTHSKITKIMLTITVVFILSYSPALIVTIISVLKPDVWDTMTMNETIVCEFFLRLYLVNNVCNPFIYGFWDKRFLREIKLSFKKLMNRIKDLCCCRRE